MAKLKSQKAFVLLYAVLVASVILAIGFSLANIITKQIILSSIGKSSRVAYYAADGGRDCGLFWVNYADVIYGRPFDNSTPVRCGGTEFSPSLSPNPLEKSLLQLYPGVDLTGSAYTAYSFNPIDLSVDSQAACAKVTIFTFIQGASPKNYRSIVLSRGFNTSCVSMQSPRTVSRTVLNISTW
jgi:hypothetical protein